MSPVVSGILYMMAGVFFMTIMDALMKVQVASLAVFQVMFFRYLFGLVPLFLIARMTGGLSQVQTRRPWLHALRALMIFVCFACFTLALKDVSLANATAVFFAAPFFVAGLAIWLLGERIGVHRIGAIVCGFIGVLVILKPDGDAFSVASLWVVLAAFCYSVAMVLARKYAATETAVSMTVWPTLGCLLASGLFLPFVWQDMVLDDVLLFAAMGFAGGVGQFLMVTSVHKASPVIVGPFEYSAIIWAVSFDVLHWGVVPSSQTALGVMLIVAGGLYMGWRESRKRKVV